MNLSAFFSELRRRRVFRVAAVYAAAAFVIAQVADIFFPGLGLPAWSLRLVLVLLILGFPTALVLAWAFDITPEGVVRTADRGSGDEPQVERDAPSRGDAQRIAAVGGILVLALAGGAFVLFGGSFERAGAPQPEPDRSIAVLPFANLSGDADNEYFSDGITEDVLANLSRIADLKVISRTSVMGYKGTTLRLREIGEELGVAHILEGSVRREGSRVRIVAQLIDARTDRHLWAETYDRELTGIFQIQSEIAQQIARALQARLSPAEQTRIAAAATANLGAYDLYLQAREHRGRDSDENVRVRRTLLREALRLDSDFALAHAELAHTYLRVTRSLTPADLDSAATLARRALELAPERAEAHLAMASVLRRAGRRTEAAEAYRRAYELGPSEVSAISGLGWAYAGEGRYDEALRWRKRAVALDPTPGFRHRQVGITYAALGMYDEAEKWYGEAVRLTPEVWFFHQDLLNVHLHRGDVAAAEIRVKAMQTVAPGEAGPWEASARVELARGDTTAALRHLERANALARNLPVFGLGVLYWTRGERQKAEEIFQAYERAGATYGDESNEGFGVPFRLAVIHLLRGDTATAQHWLDQASRWPIEGWLPETDALPDALARHPRVQRMRADAVAERERQRQRVLREGW